MASGKVLEQLVVMLKYAVLWITDFPRLVKGTLEIVVDFVKELGRFAGQMQELARHGAMLVKGGVEGESVTKYFLTFRNSIIRSGKIEEIKDAIAKIFRDGKDDLGRYLENAVKEVSGGGLAGGKLLTAEDIAVWSKKLMDEFGTKLEKVDGFSDGETLASFNSNTNTVKYMDGVTEYMMAHEYYHAQEMFALGFNKFVKNAPLLGTPVANYTKNNWIHRFLRERYVYDKLYENRALHGLNEAEIQHAYDYISYIALELIYRKIPLPK